MGARRGPSTLWRLTVAGACGAGVAVLAAMTGAACSSGPPPHFFDGTALGPCEGFLAKEIDASECKTAPGSGLAPCSGSSAYALCNGNTFNVCTCDLPGDYFFDGGTVDTGGKPPITGTVPFLDGGGTDLPCCIGNAVFELPASECPAHCTGTKAYAVCVDQAFNACSCDIPDGYGFSDFICPGDF
jgi:hypothetical protein